HWLLLARRPVATPERRGRSAEPCPTERVEQGRTALRRRSDRKLPGACASRCDLHQSGIGKVSLYAGLPPVKLAGSRKRPRPSFFCAVPVMIVVCVSRDAHHAAGRLAGTGAESRAGAWRRLLMPVGGGGENVVEQR